MDLNAVSVFIKVVQEGSFSSAAKRLGMPNTTVSAKVAALEASLGVTLIQRTTRKLHVTAAGTAFFKRCVHALQELEIGEAELKQESVEPMGLLRVTASVDAGRTVLPQLVCAVLQKYPKLKVEMVITNRIVDMVTEGIDLALRAGELKDSTLVAKKFMNSEMGLWAGAGYLKKYGTPTHPKLLAKHDCLIHSAFKAAGIKLTNGKETIALEISGRVAADDFETIKSFAILDLGIAFLPNFICGNDALGKSLVQVLPRWRPTNSSRLSFVYPSQPFVPPKVRAFLEVANTFAEKT